MKTFEQVKMILNNRINKLKTDLEFLTDLKDESSDYEKQFKIKNLLKNNLKVIYQNQYEITVLLLLYRNFDYCDEKNFIEEIEYFKDSYKNSLLNNPIPSTTNMSYNICCMWEVEVNQRLLKFLEKLV